MQRDGDREREGERVRERAAAGVIMPRKADRKKSGRVAALCAEDAVAVATSHPRVCADGSHGPLRHSL